MWILFQEPGIHEVALVVVLRPDRRGCTRSPRPLDMNLGGYDQGFHLLTVRVTDHTGAGRRRWRERGNRDKERNQQGDDVEVSHFR